MRVLGIDPGSLRTGYGIVESTGSSYKIIAGGCITNSSKDPADKRYKKIFSVLKEVINKEKPDYAAFENVIFCNNRRVAIKLGEARGVALLSVAMTGISICEFAPKKIKQAVVGNGNASKQQVQNMVQRLLNLKELPAPDMADALAAAICGINHADRNPTA